MAGTGNLTIVILTFVIFHCFEFSLCCLLLFWSVSLLMSLFISLIQCWSSISLSLCLIVSTIPVESISCPFVQNSLSPIRSNVLLTFLMLILSLSTQVNDVQRCFRAENVTSRPLRQGRSQNFLIVTNNSQNAPIPPLPPYPPPPPSPH